MRQKSWRATLDFLTQNAYYLSVGFNSLFFRFYPAEGTELAPESKKFSKNALKRYQSAIETTKNITIRERNRLKSPENDYKR